MKPDIQFLINCCKINDSKKITNETKSYLENHDGKDLSNLISLANSHGVFPLLYNAISQYVSEHRTQEDFNHLKQWNLSIVMQNMSMTAELFRVSNELGKNDIKQLPFKGPTLAQMAYGDITQRQYGDLDILIDRQDIYKAAELIVGLGYEPMDSIEFLKNDLKLDVEKNYEFYKKNNGTKLELHWRLTSSYFARKFENFDYTSATNEVVISGKVIRTLDTNVLLIYLCLHGSSHMWERLEWICDLDRLISSASESIDWEKTIGLASNFQCTKPLLVGLGLAMDFFDTTLPTKLEQKVLCDNGISKAVKKIKDFYNEDSIFENHESKTKNLTIFMFQLGLMEHFWRKSEFVAYSIFGVSDRDVMVLDLPSHLFFLYYPIRLCRIFYKYTVSPIVAIGARAKNRNVTD